MPPQGQTVHPTMDHLKQSQISSAQLPREVFLLPIITQPWTALITDHHHVPDWIGSQDSQVSSGLALKLLGPCWIRGLASPQDVLKNPQGFRTFDSQDQPQAWYSRHLCPMAPKFGSASDPGVLGTGMKGSLKWEPMIIKQ